MPFLAAVVVLVLVLAGWLLFGPGPRRQRAFRQAERCLEHGDWGEALRCVTALQTGGRLSTAWQGRLLVLAGECHQRAIDQALKDKRFEDGLEHALRATELLGLNEGEQRQRVLEALLAECRRLFAAGTGDAETQQTLQLLDRALAIQNPCAEASFWQGLCLIRQGDEDQAIKALMAAHEQSGKQMLDPALYLAMLLHRQGRPQEGLRYLGEANRADPGCPFITWQMGVSLVAGGGDAMLALRALQRAVGPHGLSMWAQHPERAWVEAFPEGKSYIRRLAAHYPYVCPVLGGDFTVVLRLGQLALAQAHYRHGNFQEAVDLYTRLLQDSPPTVALLRGLGLALARLERYDLAYKQLRIALEQEDPKDPFTAGYLALCGALGKPTRPEDKPSNVAWAIGLLTRYPLTGNAEWAGLLAAVCAEARTLDVALSREVQELLCDTLASVHAADARAAASYAQLARSYAEAVRPIHAWLYTRAASATGYTSDQDLELLGRTFRDAGPARAYFEQQQWSFEDAEYTYLQRCAAQAPGTFPSALGADYAAVGETFLLERARRQEEAGNREAARECVEVLLQLAPHSIAGHDRLAGLHYRQGDLDRAVALLDGWHRLAPADHWPLIRSAILEQERGNARRRAEAIDRALGLTRGRLRAAVAYLGARLALRETLGRLAKPRSSGNGQPAEEEAAAEAPSFETPLSLLQECLQHDPGHVEAQWGLAAVRSVLGDAQDLASQAPAMNRPQVPDARFQFMGAVCHLAARDYPGAVELAGRAAALSSGTTQTGDNLAAESHFVLAWAYLHQNDLAAARTALHKVASAERGPSTVHARALLGRLHFDRGEYDDAIRWWSSVDPARRAAWKVDEPLRQTVLLAGLLSHQAGRFEQAAERFREAGRLGLRDRRLGPLLSLALVQAGQRLLYQQAQGG